jgi:hypothetical protein
MLAADLQQSAAGLLLHVQNLWFAAQEK